MAFDLSGGSELYPSLSPCPEVPLKKISIPETQCRKVRAQLELPRSETFLSSALGSQPWLSGFLKMCVYASLVTRSNPSERSRVLLWDF